MRVIIGSDGSEFSKYAVEEFCRLFDIPPQSEIQVVSVYERPAPMAAEPFAISAEYRAELESGFRRQAEGWAEETSVQLRGHLGDRDIGVTTQIGVGSPGRIIVEIAKEWGCDMIVVGSHGRGFWSRALIGSTSDKLVHHAPCSVLVVRRPEA
jgi:nucleotide-binding universal stress UspA family protein